MCRDLYTTTASCYYYTADGSIIIYLRVTQSFGFNRLRRYFIQYALLGYCSSYYVGYTAENILFHVVN